MDPEERKVQGAAIHAVRETINNALTERQTALQQAALAQNWQVKPLILLCRPWTARWYSSSCYSSARTNLPVLY